LAPHRAGIIQRLREQGVEANIGTWHMPLTTYFRTRYGYRPGDYQVTDQVFSRSLALPLYETLSPDDQQVVVQGLLGFVNGVGGE
jgi:perosamine synthetase